MFRCDTGRVGGNMGVVRFLSLHFLFNKIPLTSQRDYGAILMNRVGRKGYKIHIQVVGLLWDFR